MERRNIQRLVARMRNRSKARSGDAPAPRKNIGKWAGWAIFGLVALVLCGLAFSGSRGGLHATTELENSVPAAMPTAAAGSAFSLGLQAPDNSARALQSYDAFNAVKQPNAPNPATQQDATA